MSARPLDALGLPVWASAFAMIAEEMGAVLVRGALSPNIRERRDASCALFDADGRMVAQAAHIPVHLGAMPEAVRAVRARRPMPGDVFLLNSPWQGGSHLPDLTMVEAIADRVGDADDAAGHEGRAVGAADSDVRVAGYAVVRAHHADVGGMSPGSMPQGATELVQEGLIVPPVRIERGGRAVDEMLDVILANVRTPDERRGDLAAQRAACAAGAAGWRALLAREGRERVETAGERLLDYSERRAVARLRAIEAEGFAEDALEGDGVSDAPVPLRVALAIRNGELHLDFAGTSPMVRGNVNCPIQVTRAAALFVLRSLLDDDVPTNDGIARPIHIVTPDDCCLAARAPAAVAAGNVEMSQRITDLLFAAFADAGVAVPAQGQGTMNNVTFGSPRGWTFYETLGGGQGASARGDGPDAVHVGMSNTRNTPIEALERAYPIIIERYEIRRGSGGAGQHRGGDGVIRRYRVRERCTVTLLTERRATAPRGAAGGADGARGENLLNGEPLPAKCRRELEPGDVLEIRTPGGGGWGAA